MKGGGRGNGVANEVCAACFFGEGCCVWGVVGFGWIFKR